MSVSQEKKRAANITPRIEAPEIAIVEASLEVLVAAGAPDDADPDLGVVAAGVGAGVAAAPPLPDDATMEAEGVVEDDGTFVGDGKAANSSELGCCTHLDDFGMRAV